MNRNVAWTLFAIAVYWLSIPAIGTEWVRNIVAFFGIVIALATFWRYLPNAWEKYRNNQSAGEWRMLMGIELFWLGFGVREFWLFGDRQEWWDADKSPVNGFLAFVILCAGLLCFSAASEPIPQAPHRNGYVIFAAALAGALGGMLLYRFLWG